MRRVYHGGGIEYADGGGTGALADGKYGSLKLPEALVQLLPHLFGAKQQRVHLQFNERGGLKEKRLPECQR